MDYLVEALGADREQVWKSMATGMGNEFLAGEGWNGERIALKVGNWVLTLDSDRIEYEDMSVAGTRLRAPYINRDQFRFHISPEGLMGRLGKLFGLRDVETGDAAFDKQFLVRASDPEQVERFLANPAIRAGMLDLGHMILCVKDDEGVFGVDFPDGVDELYLEIPNLAATHDSLKALFDFFAVCLHQLCHIGSAYPDDPGLKLD